MAFNENTRVKIPAILHLCRLGFNYLPLANAKWDMRSNIFTDIFESSIKRINQDLNDEDVNRALEDITLALDNDDLGEAFYSMLTAKSGIKLIDFNDFENNTFHVVTELPYKNGDDEFRPDM
jgi:type I restriction enzyme R subunit